MKIVPENNKKTDSPPQCPNPLFTRLFTEKGAIEDVIKTISKDAQGLAGAWLMYYRGDIDGAYKCAAPPDEGRFSNSTPAYKTGSYYTQVGTGMLLASCAMYKGDAACWKQAREITATAGCKSAQEKASLPFWLAAQDSALHDGSKFPQWLCRGNFDALPYDSHPSAWFFYAKYLYIRCKNYHRGDDKNAQKHAEAMRVLPFVIEPLLSGARREGIFVCGIYLHLLCAIAYYFSGSADLCGEHAKSAIRLALPDKLYSPLAEYASLMGYVLYEHLYEIDKAAFDAVKRLASRLGSGWYGLHNAMLGRSLISSLTLREYEVASLAAYNMSNREIAERLHLSVGTVKQTLYNAMGKANVSSRGELGRLI